VQGSASAPETGRKLNDSVTVRTWLGGRTSALSLTFDDSSRDHTLHVKPLLARFGFKATFFVITSALDAPDDHNGDWDEFIALAADGHEIGSHTVSHRHLCELPPGDPSRPETREYELAFSKAEIERRIPGRRCLSMSYPYAESDAGIEALTKRYYLSGRIGHLNPEHPAWNTASPADWMRIVSYVPHFPTPRETPAGDLPELERMKNLLDVAVARGQWAVIMIHSVVPFDRVASYGGYETMSTEWLAALCGWVGSRDEIWVDTVGHVTLYARERDAARVEGFAASNDKMEFSLRDGLDKEVFDQALTLEVGVPGDWRKARVIGAASLPDATDVTGGHVRFDAVPGEGKIRLEKLL